MHGFSSGSTFLVNAEVDSMGGVVDGGVGIGNKPSPRRAAIEKAQADLRLEYDVREERRRELEFLEKGGNPLDFKFGHAASMSVQSTSHTYQHPDQILTSEAKGSFALTASPHGDSVESSGRLGITTACEPNSADNFDGENEILGSERKSKHLTRGSITTPEHSSQLDGSQHVKESEDSPIFHPKKGQAYRRRNRSRANRDGPRSSSSDIASRGGQNSSLPGRHVMLSKPVAPENNFEIESDGTHGLQLSSTSRASEISEAKLNISTTKEKREGLKLVSVQADDIPAATTMEPGVVAGKENVVNVDVVGPPCSIENKEKVVGASLLNESGKANGDSKSTPNDAIISNAAIVTKGLDSESLFTHTSLSVDGNGNGNIESDLYTNLKNVDSNGVPKEHKLPLGEKSVSVDDEMVNEKDVANPVENASCVREDQSSISHPENGSADKDQEVDRDRFSSRDKPERPTSREELGAHDHSETKPDKEHISDDSIPKVESSCPAKPLSSVETSSHEVIKNDLSAPPVPKPQSSNEIQRKNLDRGHEDRLLEEARIIEAKRKRIAELSVGLTPREHRRKSHWDFVLEEMAWLANDFSQERVWKITAASQICHRVAFASRIRLEEQNKCWKQKSVAHTLANAVMEFWHSASLLVKNGVRSQPEERKYDASSGADEIGQMKDEVGILDKDEGSEVRLQSTRRTQELAVYGYAVRFLEHNSSSPPFVKDEGSVTPDVACDTDLMEVTWQDQLTEENLFYLVPPGAMEAYRQSVELCLTEFERASNNIQEEVDTSLYDAAAEIGYQENDYEEDEGENVYYLPGAFDTGRPKKKRKNMKSYELGGDFGYGRCLDSRNGTPTSALMGKRPSDKNFHAVGSIPTKRVRTASRPRGVGPFGVGSAGVASAPSRADASSGDTNSFQDDQSTLHGGSIVPRGSEVDSAMDFDKQSIFDSAEILAKPKKKKKIKHPGAAYDPNWQVDSSLQNDQKDHVRKRSDSLQLESNGNSGLFPQHPKKPKTFKQSLDNSFDNAMPMSGSVASPVASQMSNMSSQSKIIKLFAGRDRSRKAKALKVCAVQSGSGSPWSSFEDQALIVLVHDMGPNWELVSDAINSTLRFKCIFRTPQECKERHKGLMNKTPGDGADSAEDSGSSQPYPSTLPGIPKGSARQLFQQLQRPMEEDTIKSHFEKIILIGQQLHYRKKQNDIQDLKQIAPVHGSHVGALSQVIPNNLNGVILTPLDLCDIAASNQEAIPLGFQGSHAGGLSLPNQGASPSMHPPGGPNSSIPGLPSSPSMGIGNNLASQSSQFANSRDARYPVPRSTSLPIEEQQRLQQYSHMLPGRNVQPSNLSSGSHSGPDRGVRILPGGNGAGMVAGMSRSLPLSRPGLQGISSSSLLNTGNMLSSSMGGMPSNMHMHSGTASGQGNSMFRPRDALHMVRPGQSSDHQRQMNLPDSGSPGVPPFSALSSGFSNQTTSPLQTYAGHHHHPMPQQHSHVLGASHHPHVPGSNHVTAEQQAYLRAARDRQIQQRILQRQHQQQQQQQQHAVSSALMTHAQTPSQLPVSSSVQNASQVQSPSSSQPVSLPPLTPSSPITHVSSQSSQPQKHQVGKATPQGLGRNAQGGPSTLMNQVGKRQRQVQQIQQQYQQSGRQHPQQRQQSQPQQQAKILKGMGRSNMLHQNLPIDPSNLNGLTANSGNQVAEKGEQAVHLMQPQGYSGSGLNATQQSKHMASPQSSGHLQHQKPYSNSVPATPKQVQTSSHLDASNQGQVPTVSSNTASLGSTQGLPSTAIPSPNLQGPSQPPVKAVNQSQPALQRAVQQNRQLNSDPLTKSQTDHAPLEQQTASINSLNAGAQSVCGDSTSVLPLSSSVSSTVRKQAQESVSDSTMTNATTSAGPISSAAITTPSSNEMLPCSDGLGQRQLPGNISAHGHAVQFQHQPSQLHHPSPQPVLPQKQSSQKLQQLDKSPPRVPQQQPSPQIQAGQNSVFARTSNSRLE